ncbi:unnamed protein product [Dibothriocephalus latus]|uniref:Reverse transcriptase domain-containing protein n=1 Tax=Dibothriocephalus latus TaxID=60516 RepID=A0A3P7LGS6_DIBLA|nr:unnamed protein product [Dibothriocephalus latus]
MAGNERTHLPLYTGSIFTIVYYFQAPSSHCRRCSVSEPVGHCVSAQQEARTAGLQVAFPKFWACYVDDTFLFIKRSKAQEFKALLISIFPEVQFTMEKEVNNQLPFLDVQVTKLEGGKIRTTVSRTATNTLRILHFRSSHPRSKGEGPKFWLAIPYAKNVSEVTARILRPFGLGAADKLESKIRQQSMKPKDQLPSTEQSAVVYSIPCQDCDTRYVSETGKRLNTRLHEHQLANNRKDMLFMVYEHVQQKNHLFAFDKAKVIGRANDKMARLLLESWFSTGTPNRTIVPHNVPPLRLPGQPYRPHA